MRELFRRFIPEVDAVLVIAPETDGLLAELVTDAGEKAQNCTPAAIALCTDKLRLAEHCEQHGIPTIPTVSEEWERPPKPAEFPCLVKPRDGAGCVLTYALRDATAWRRAARLYVNEPVLAVRQPSIAGRHLSIAAIFRDNSAPVQFPIGEQRIEIDGRSQLSYGGGTLPADLGSESHERITSLVLDAAISLPGLRGYVGLDVLIPRSTPDRPLLVEINPRLTTSYIGYRRLCRQNLMAAMLGCGSTALTWGEASFAFDKAGQVVAGG